MSDHKGARLVLDALPAAAHLIADRGYDSSWFRAELETRGIEPCIPSSRSRKVPFAYDTMLYRQRHKVENLFAKLKDWRRVATLATIDARRSSSPPSRSPQLSCSGYETRTSPDPSAAASSWIRLARVRRPGVRVAYRIGRVD